MLYCNLESPGIFCDVTNVVTPTALGAFINYLRSEERRVGKECM